MRIIQISESEFSVQGHGVHTAFVETMTGLSKYTDNEVIKNSFSRADIRHIHTVGLYSLAQLLFGSGRKVISAHIVPDSLVGSLVGAQYWVGLARWYLCWFYNRADVVIAVSDATQQTLVQMGVRRPIEIVYNMVDVREYTTTSADKKAMRRRFGIDAGAKVVVSNGQIQPRKRVDTFINIARAAPGVQFIWVGGMPFGKIAADHEEMQTIINTAPSNVTFTGVIPLDEARAYFVASDVFVSTSAQETFGIAIIEAAASGLPVVLRDIADYDQTFRPDAVMCTEDQFISSIQYLFDDNDYYHTMKNHAKALAARYDSKNISHRLDDIYRSLI